MKPVNVNAKNRVWFMNADFEMELAANSERYVCPVAFRATNMRLAAHLTYLAEPGDVILVEGAPGEGFIHRAEQRGINVYATSDACDFGDRLFSPWGWTPRSARIAKQIKSHTHHPDLNVIRIVNSKLWSLSLEQKLGISIPGSAAATTFDELEAAVANACRGGEDKWVIKSPYGFAARDRVLGRGPRIQYPQAKWAHRRFEMGESLLFQPWLKVIREYGVVMTLSEGGAFEIVGISDLQTNGAGTGTGYLLGRSIPADRLRDLESIAGVVAERLTGAGYFGPVGIDTLEHEGGFLPLLEINARHTMGFVALAIERDLAPREPVFWSTKPKP